MAFFWRIIQYKFQKNITKNTLQVTLPTNSSGKFNSFVYIFRKSEKRASSPVFFGRKGSMAVEASLVLPLFLFFFLNLISILQLLSCYGRIEAALHQTARKWALYAGVSETENNEFGRLSVIFLPGEIKKAVGEVYLEKSPIVGRAGGISCLLSKVPDENENMDLIVSYQVSPMFSILGFSNFAMVNRCRIRAWTGYDVNRGLGDEESGEEIVYITEHGTVYHVSRSCTHLKLSIQSVGQDKIGACRNEDGGRYYPCEKCGGGGMTDIYFIAGQGDRYHTSIGCSGLKRQIQAVPMSQVSGMGVCSRCGGQ